MNWGFASLFPDSATTLSPTSSETMYCELAMLEGRLLLILLE